MKENTVLHALMYIFKSTTKNQIALECIGGDMSSELSAAGFDKTVVNKAIQWILDLSNESDIEKSAQFSDLNKISYALRYFIPYECDLFNVDCRSYLLRLEQRGILSPANRERVIEQTIALQDSDIDVNLLKWVTMMVLYNQPDDESRQLAEILAREEIEVQYN
jgi:Smg protein